MPDADRLHVGLDELHRVVDRKARVHRAAGRVDVDRDVLLGILGLQVQQLGDDQVRDLIVDGRAEEDDPLVEQTAVDVERSLSARGLLDDHWDKWAHSLAFVSLRRPDSSSEASWPILGPSVSTDAPPSPAPLPAPTPAAASFSGVHSCSRASAWASGIGFAPRRSGRSPGAPRDPRAPPPGARRARRSSSSVCGSMPSRSAVGASTSSTSSSRRADLLGLDDRRDHGLAAQRLRRLRAPSRRGSPTPRGPRSAGRPRARCRGGRASAASAPTSPAPAP